MTVEKQMRGRHLAERCQNEIESDREQYANAELWISSVGAFETIAIRRRDSDRDSRSQCTRPKVATSRYSTRRFGMVGDASGFIRPPYRSRRQNFDDSLDRGCRPFAAASGLNAVGIEPGRVAIER